MSLLPQPSHSQPPRSPGRPTGSGGRLCSITYAKIAGWTGLRVSTVRSYASRKAFNAHSLTSTLSWVNARRAEAGLPLIGALTQSSELTPLNHNFPADAELDTYANETTPTPPVTPTPAPTYDTPIPPLAPHYNPVTGDFSL